MGGGQNKRFKQYSYGVQWTGLKRNHLAKLNLAAPEATAALTGKRKEEALTL